MIGFQKFPSIGQAHEMLVNADKMGMTHLTFQPKLKLHGTNACVRISHDGTVTCQRRKGDLAEGESHFGFEQWVESQNERWQEYVPQIRPEHDFYIYGEYAGRGIQKKSDAVTRMDHKAFFVFAINHKDDWHVSWFDLLQWDHKQTKMHILPWYYERMGFVADMTLELKAPFDSELNQEKIKEQLQLVNDNLGKHDAYIGELFDIWNAPGEGLVYYPVENHRHGTLLDNSFDLAFKLKTEAHKTVARQRIRKPGQKPTEAEQAFAEAYVTPARLDQALFEVTGGERLEAKQIGDFIRWVSEDVHKECQVDLEQAELKWKRVARLVGKLAADHAKSIVFKF